MSIEKFLSLVTTKNLYLTRLDGFKDTWEGLWPKSVIRNFEDENSHLGFAESSFHLLNEDLRKRSFVCCWHQNVHESAALLDLYSGKSGVAIRTTVGSLMNSLSNKSNFEIGRAIYIDFDDHDLRLPLNMLVAPFIKRKSFEHEKEVRLLLWDINKTQPEESKGAVAAVNLNAMLDEIRVAPDSDPWILGIIEIICRKFDVLAPVTQSSLYSPLVY